MWDNVKQLIEREENAYLIFDDTVIDAIFPPCSGEVYRNYEGLQGQGSHPPDTVPLAEDAPLRETRYSYRYLEGLDFEFKQDYEQSNRMIAP